VIFLEITVPATSPAPHARSPIGYALPSSLVVPASNKDRGNRPGCRARSKLSA